MIPLPDEARVHVPQTLAREFVRAAQTLPVRENEAYYDDDLQVEVLDGVRITCRDGFDWLVDEIRHRLNRAPFCVNVSGLQYDAENRFFIALNRAFGRLVSKPLQKPRSQLVQYIHHRQDLIDPKSGRAYTELFHTDGADLPDVIDIVSMACLHPDETGEGHSRLIGMDTICQEFEERFGRDALNVLRETSFPWMLAKEFGGEVAWRRVLDKERMCWRRYTIDAAVNEKGLDIGKEAKEVLDAMMRLTTETSRAYRWLMGAGDFLLMDNHKCLHARTCVTRSQSKRLMMRSWIRTEPGGATPL